MSTAGASEFILDPDRTPVLFVEPFGPSFAQAIKRLEEYPAVQVAVCASSLEAASLARQIGICLIVVHVSKEDHLLKHVTMQRLLQQQISRKNTRVLITSSMKGEAAKDVHAMLEGEILPEPVSDKSLVFKIERHLKLLPKIIDDSPVNKKSDSKANDPLSVAEPMRAPRLELESDCWLQLKGGAKQIGGRWVIKLKGPAPTSGSWQAIETEDGQTEAWQWMPSDPENDPYIKEQGAWVFFGQKPDHQNGAWTFISKTPDLSFYFEGESYGSKFSSDENGGLIIADDSAAAKNAHPVLDEKSVTPGSASKGGQAKPAVADVGSSSKALEFKMVAPLELESDCWLIQGRKPRKVTKKWMLQLLGPSPDYGKWSPIEGAEEGGDTYWQWVPANGETDPFIKEEGAWVFKGAAPKFTDSLWVFVGEKPELAFYYEGESYGAKFSTSADGSLSIAKDSNASRAMMTQIEATIEKVITTKVNAKGDSEASEADPLNAAFEFAFDTFGPTGGEWESVSFGSGQRRWYVFLPFEVLNGAVDVRSVGEYWMYFGTAAPKLEVRDQGQFWVSRERKPQSYPNFAALPKQVQTFLAEHFSGQSQATLTQPSAPAPTAGEDESADTALISAASTSLEDSETPLMTSEEAPRSEAVEGPLEIRLAAEDFGAPGGEWEAAGIGSQLRRWYVYLPVEFLMGEVQDIRGLDAYWTYFGERAPRTSGGETIFVGREPKRWSSFADLPKPIQSFLLSFFEHAQSAAQAEAAQTEPEEQRSSFRFPIDGFGAEGGDWEIAGTGTDGRRWYLYLPVELLEGKVEDVRNLSGYWNYFGSEPPSRVTEGQAQYWMFYDRTPQRTERFMDLAPPIRGFLMQHFGNEAPETVTFAAEQAPAEAGDYVHQDEKREGSVLEYAPEAEASAPSSEDFVDQTVQAPAIEYAEEKEEKPAGEVIRYDVSPKQRKPEASIAVSNVEKGRNLFIASPSELSRANGPQLIAAETPPGPSLSPIAVALLVSELIRKRDIDRKKIGGRLCEYLAASFGGLRVELWVKNEYGWFCSGTPDASEGEYLGAFGEADPALGYDDELGVYTAPVRGRGRNGKELLLGAVVIGGKGAEKVAADYATAVARTATGLLLTLSGQYPEKFEAA